MFDLIDLDTARSADWDVIVAGSGFSAMFFLHGLPPGLRVLIVEKGGIVPWERQVRDRVRPKEEIRIDNRSGHPKEFVAHTLFGGNSNCWWGQVPRFHPNDFRLASLYGVGEDWPLGYEDLEPHYFEVEKLMQIAGGGTDAVFPRSGPYDYPPHAPSRTDQVLLAHDPSTWLPVPTARANGGDRAQCCANGICHDCPVDAKFTVLNSVQAFERPEVRLLTDTEVRGVETSAGRARSLVVRQGGVERRVGGETVALATNAFFNAAILLRSGVGGSATGQYLHEQASVVLDIDIDRGNWFGGSSITLHGYAAYDGPHRSEAGAVLMENFNAPYRLRPERGRWTERMWLKLIAEDLPRAENRVVMDDAEEPLVEWHGHGDYAERGLARAETMLPQLLPFAVERIAAREISKTEAHIQGTHRMGADPRTSVTDAYCRLHFVPNLFVLGSGAFPSCSPANPTLTLSALALRAGRSVT